MPGVTKGVWLRSPNVRPIDVAKAKQLIRQTTGFFLTHYYGGLFKQLGEDLVTRCRAHHELDALEEAMHQMGIDIFAEAPPIWLPERRGP